MTVYANVVSEYNKAKNQWRLKYSAPSIPEIKDDGSN